MKIQQVGICGCGLMGSGIAQVVAAKGVAVVVLEATEELGARGLKQISRRLDRLVEKGSVTAEEKKEVTERIRGTTNPSDLSNCDLIVEAIVEDLTAKLQLWETLRPNLKESVILASNTSAFSITDMMMATGRAEQFVGLHFFNPVPVMSLVEVSRTVLTKEEVYTSAIEFVKMLGKVPVRVPDRPGFVVNRLLIPYLLDAIRIFEQNTGSISEIDEAMKLGCGYPMGPFLLLDLIGLDTVHSIANVLFEEIREQRFASPILLKRMVQAGWLGRKSGRGFYDYSDSRSPKPLGETLR